MSYRLFPKNKPSIVDECCSCPADKQIPVKGDVDIKLERGIPVSIVKHWDATCGLFLTIRDQDKYFPHPQWVDNRPGAIEDE